MTIKERVNSIMEDMRGFNLDTLAGWSHCRRFIENHFEEAIQEALKEKQ